MIIFYFFQLLIGSIFRVAYNYFDGFCGIDSLLYAVIDKIDSIDVGNKFLRKFCGSVIGDTTIPNCNGFSYTEYIGSNYIFPYIYCPDFFDQESYWICDYGDSTIQNFYAFENNCLNVSVDKIANTIGNILIYPNPNNGTFRIIAETSIQKTVQLKLFSAIGQLIYNSTIQPALDKIETKISLSNSNAGVYNIIQLSVDNKLYYKKLIIE